MRVSASVPVDDGALDPVAHVLVELDRQIAVDVLSGDASELRAQVDRAGPRRKRTPRSRRRSRHLRVRKREIVHRHRHRAGFALPAHVPGHRFERERIGEDARQREAHAAARELQRAPQFGGVEAAGDTVGAGKELLRGDAEPLERTARGKGAWCLRRSLPRQLAVHEGAARREACEVVAQTLGQRQVSGHCRQRCEIEAWRREPATGCAASLVAVERQREVGRRQRRAVDGAKRQRARMQRALTIVVLPADPAGEVRQAERRQLRLEARVDIGKLQVRDNVARLPVRDVDPEPQRAFSGLDRKRQRQPFAPRGEVGVVEAEVEAPLHLVPVRRIQRGDIAAQVEWSGELGGGVPVRPKR